MISILAKQLLSDIQEHLPKASAYSPELSAQLKKQIESTLTKMNIVSRTEFDAQTEVLHRTQKKLNKLTERIAELEKLD